MTVIGDRSGYVDPLSTPRHRAYDKPAAAPFVPQTPRASDFVAGVADGHSGGPDRQAGLEVLAAGLLIYAALGVRHNIKQAA
jgi:hypothetical protein